MTIKELKAQLAGGQVGSLYLMHGTETYMKRLYLDKIQAALALINPEFNTLTLKNQKPEPDTVRAFIDCPPMMSDKKLLYLQNTDLFKSATEAEKEFWKTVFSDLPDYLVLVFSEENTDKRSTLYKTISKIGCCVEFATLDVSTIGSFILMEAKRHHKEMAQDTILYLIDRVGDQLGDISAELDKLFFYTENKIITKHDIDSVVSVNLQNRVFELIDAIMARDAQKALIIVKELKIQKEPYQKVSYLTLTSFERLLKARLLLDKKTPLPTILSSLEIHPYVAKKYVAAAQKFSSKALMQTIKTFSQTDLALRSGVGEEWLSYETMVISAAKLN